MKNKKNILKIFFILSFIFIYFFTCSITNAATKDENLPMLYCNNNILMDAETGNVLFEKNGYSKIYPD